MDSRAILAVTLRIIVGASCSDVSWPYIIYFSTDSSSNCLKVINLALDIIRYPTTDKD